MRACDGGRASCAGMPWTGFNTGWARSRRNSCTAAPGPLRALRTTPPSWCAHGPCAPGRHRTAVVGAGQSPLPASIPCPPLLWHHSACRTTAPACSPPVLGSMASMRMGPPSYAQCGIRCSLCLDCRDTSPPLRAAFFVSAEQRRLGLALQPRSSAGCPFLTSSALVPASCVIRVEPTDGSLFVPAVARTLRHRAPPVRAGGCALCSRSVKPHAVPQQTRRPC